MTESINYSIIRNCVLFTLLSLSLVSIVVWEAQAVENEWRYVPSQYLRDVKVMIDGVMERMGVWIARLFSITYYFENVWRYLKVWIEHFYVYFLPYIKATERLYDSGMPLLMSWTSFVKGFFSEHYGEVVVLTAFLASFLFS